MRDHGNGWWKGGEPRPRSSLSLLLHLALLLTFLLQAARGLCPLAIGYTLRPGKGLPLGAEQAAAVPLGDGTRESHSSVAALAKLCSLSTACVAFTTVGTLVTQLPGNATWPDIAPGAGRPCDGVYLRSAVLEGWRAEVTGVEVSHEYDLPLNYYPRVPLAECERLCETTPGCRSFSFYSSFPICSLKSATCAEAGLQSGGCMRRYTRHEAFVHKDRTTAREGTVGAWRDVAFFFTSSSLAVNASEAHTLCQQQGGQLSSVHRDTTLGSVQRMLETLVAPLADAGETLGAAGIRTCRFWTVGRHQQGGNASSGVTVIWDDGSQFRLGSRNVTVEQPGGCLVLDVSSPGASGMSLKVVDCGELAFPLCVHYPAGTVYSRVQVDSRLVIRYDDFMGREDSYLFCKAKGAQNFRTTNSVRDLELGASLAHVLAHVVAWSDGTRNSTGTYLWRDGTIVPRTELLTPGDPNNACMVTRGFTEMWPTEGELFRTANCDDIYTVFCYWPPTVWELDVDEASARGSREVARLRLIQDNALLFVATGATYIAAQEECKQLGATLASVPSSNFNDLITSTWFEIEPANSTSYSRGSRRTLTYLGGDTFSSVGLQWLDGSPVNYTGPQFGVILPTATGCLAITTTSGIPPGPTWMILLSAASTCNVVHNFTCRAPAKSFIQPSAVLAFRSSIFELHLKVPRTFDDARETCRARGGDLASLSADRDYETVRNFLYRVRHELGDPTPVTSEGWDYWVGATTNKTDRALYLTDFYWTDGQPFYFPMLPYDSIRLAEPIQHIFRMEGIRSAMTFSPGINGIPGLARRHANFNFPFLCKTPIGMPLATQQALDGTTYEVLSTPYALPYHGAEQVCQTRGGHLAGASTTEQLSLIYQLCARALRSLPQLSSGGFTSHDLPAACWVGLFCPLGWSTDARVHEGFGSKAWQHLAAQEPSKWLGRNTSSILPGPGHTCSSADDLVWLGGRNIANSAQDLVATVEAAAMDLSFASRCAAAFPAGGATSNGTSGWLGMADCRNFAAFVCERQADASSNGTGSSANNFPMPGAPAAVGVNSIADFVIIGLTTVSVDTPPERLPSTVQYLGCYTMASWQAGSSSSSSSSSSAGGLVTSPAPLSVLLSTDVSSYEACYSLATAFNMSHFALSAKTDCWGGWEPPTLPFVNMTDDILCRAVCMAKVPSPITATSPPSPGCSAPGYSVVFSLGKRVMRDHAPPATPTPYVCMSEQLLAAPNATLVGQLHVSNSQLPQCEVLCSRLSACDMYVYDTRSLACVLLGLPYAVRLADMPLRDNLWARVTCVKGTRIVDGVVLRELPISDLAAVSNTTSIDATYLCSPQLSSMSYSAMEEWSPSHRKPVPDAGACSRSCFFNASCHGFVLRQQALPEGGVQYTCMTYGSITKQRTEAWMANRPWVWIPGFSSAGEGADGGMAEGCLMLERLSPPPPYVCSQYVDVGGWELQQLEVVDEHRCRLACDLDEQCSVYVVQEVSGSPLSCSIRHRAFYNLSDSAPAVRGTNNRPTAANTVSFVRSCLHPYRMLETFGSTVAGRDSRFVKLGVDRAWHVCVPHMDIMGVDELYMASAHENDCSVPCSRRAKCNYMILTAEDPRSGYCYAKYEPIVFNLWGGPGYPAMGGITRLDLTGIADVCINLERQLPRVPPELVCGSQYHIALPLLARIISSSDSPAPEANTTNSSVTITASSGPFACEALCLANSSCAGYMWTAHNSTCTLSAVLKQGAAGSSQLLPATGPNALISQSCIHIPRLMEAAKALLPTGFTTDGSGAGAQPETHVQAYSEWNYCVPGPGLGLVAWAGPNLLAAYSMPQLAGEPADSPACMRACSRLCTGRQGCQAFSVLQRNSSASGRPVCFLLGWAATAAYATWAGAIPIRPYGEGLSYTCVSMSPDKAMLAGPGGALERQAVPVAVQAYRTKQYSLQIAPMLYTGATAHCQSSGGQLASFGSQSELDVVAGLLLQQHTQLRLQPGMDLPLQPAAFWMGLAYSNTTSSTADGCMGWCFSHGRPTNSSLLLSAHWSNTDNGSTLQCGAVSMQGSGASRNLSFLAGDCNTWQLPFICEVVMLQDAGVGEGGGTLSSAPVQLFPGATGYAGAAAQAAAAGAQLAVLDLSGPAVESAAAHHRRLLQDSAAAVFPNVSTAVAACGAGQLLSTGCWVQTLPPTDACSDANNTTSPLCGVHAALIMDSQADTAFEVASLAQQLMGSSESSLGPAGSRCALVLYNSTTLSYSVSPVLCSTPGAFLASVVDPEAPVRAAAVLNTGATPVVSTPNSAQPASSPLPSGAIVSAPTSSPAPQKQSSGTIAGAVVGSIVGALLLVTVGAVVAIRRRRIEVSKAPSNKHASQHDAEAGVQDLPTPPGNMEYGQANSGHPTARAATTDIATSVEGVIVARGSQLLPTGGDTLPATVNISATASGSAGTRGDSGSMPQGSPPHNTASQPSETTTTSSSGAGKVHAALLQGSGQGVLQQLLVTEGDADQSNVTWRINPSRDISWDVSNVLGTGTFGIVYRGTYKGKPVAVKTVNQSAPSDKGVDAMRALLHEARILAKVRHPNVVICYGGCITEDSVFIIEELMTMSLRQLMKKQGGLLPLPVLLRIGMDIAKGLFQLHPTIVHRDLKPDNVLIDESGTAKISDFGLARFKMHSYLLSTNHLAAGTLPFMAPEVFDEKLSGITEKADIYSLAMVMVCMLINEPHPWKDYHYGAIAYKVSTGDRPQLPADPARCPPRLVGLLRRMWAADPHRRPGAADVLKQLGLILRDVAGAGQGTTAAGAAQAEPVA